MDTGSVISINVGMKVEAVRDKTWNYHRGKLLGIFVAALKQSPDIIGMLVTEVGTADNSYGAAEREEVRRSLQGRLSQSKRRTKCFRA